MIDFRLYFLRGLRSQIFITDVIPSNLYLTLIAFDFILELISLDFFPLDLIPLDFITVPFQSCLLNFIALDLIPASQQLYQ